MQESPQLGVGGERYFFRNASSVTTSPLLAFVLRVVLARPWRPPGFSCVGCLSRFATATASPRPALRTQLELGEGIDEGGDGEERKS